MTVRAMAWAWDQPCPSPAAKLVLLKLADHANFENECWPSQATIARDTGLCRQTVNAVVKDLVEAGLISSEHRRDEKGQHSNRYFLRCSLTRQSPSELGSLTRQAGVASGEMAPSPQATQNLSVEPSKGTSSAGAHAREKVTSKPMDRSHGEMHLVQAAIATDPDNLPDIDKLPPDEQTFAWPIFHALDGSSAPMHVPDEWIGLGYQTKPEVDGYAAAERFVEYWAEGKGKGTRKSERSWQSCWFLWVNRERPARKTDDCWIDRYGWRKHLHGWLDEQRELILKMKAEAGIIRFTDEFGSYEYVHG